MKIILVAFNLVIAFFASAQNETAEVKWLTHKDSIYNLSMEYPSNWQLKPPTEAVRFFVTSYPDSDTDNFRENMNCITPMNVGDSTTIQMAKEEIEKSLAESLSDFAIIQSGFSTWNKVTAYQIEYTCSQVKEAETIELHMLQKMAIIKGKLYALTFTSQKNSYDKYIATVKRMFEAFKVL